MNIHFTILFLKHSELSLKTSVKRFFSQKKDDENVLVATVWFKLHRGNTFRLLINKRSFTLSEEFFRLFPFQYTLYSSL